MDVSFGSSQNMCAFSQQPFNKTEILFPPKDTEFEKTINRPPGFDEEEIKKPLMIQATIQRIRETVEAQIEDLNKQRIEIEHMLGINQPINLSKEVIKKTYDFKKSLEKIYQYAKQYWDFLSEKVCHVINWIDVMQKRFKLADIKFTAINFATTMQNLISITFFQINNHFHPKSQQDIPHCYKHSPELIRRSWKSVNMSQRKKQRKTERVSRQFKRTSNYQNDIQKSGLSILKFKSLTRIRKKNGRVISISRSFIKTASV